MTIVERLMEIMFEEDMKRYNNKQPLKYHTEEEFLEEKEERENKEA